MIGLISSGRFRAVFPRAKKDYFDVLTLNCNVLSNIFNNSNNINRVALMNIRAKEYECVCCSRHCKQVKAVQLCKCEQAMETTKANPIKWDATCMSAASAILLSRSNDAFKRRAPTICVNCSVIFLRNINQPNNDARLTRNISLAHCYEPNAFFTSFHSVGRDGFDPFHTQTQYNKTKPTIQTVFFCCCCGWGHQ